MGKWLGKQMTAAEKKMSEFRPKIGGGKMIPVMGYATGGSPRTTPHLKVKTSKPE